MTLAREIPSGQPGYSEAMTRAIALVVILAAVVVGPLAAYIGAVAVGAWAYPLGEPIADTAAIVTGVGILLAVAGVVRAVLLNLR